MSRSCEYCVRETERKADYMSECGVNNNDDALTNIEKRDNGTFTLTNLLEDRGDNQTVITMNRHFLLLGQ